MASPPDPDLVKMSDLARRAGVPAATIKHYLREGLLPAPRVRTSRNMAYYDAALVPRIRAIKELQRTRFLPLKVIRDLLSGADPYRTEETESALRDALERRSAKEQRTRRELVAAGLPAGELAYFESLGLVSAEGRGDDAVYTGDDLSLLRTLGAARRAGLRPEMLPHTILGPYAAALRELVRVELVMFREGVLPRAGDDLPALVDAAARLSEELVVVLRRKLLLPTLKQLVDDEARRRASAKEAPTRARARAAERPRRARKLPVSPRAETATLTTPARPRRK
jgi:DNA-binding transcriptional MerR regulator